MFFIKIHLFNVTIALLARLFGPVAYWKCEGVPAWLRAPLTPIDPDEIFAIGEWNELLEEAHDALARQRPRCPGLRVRGRGQLADFGQLWLHWFAHQFEGDIQGQRLALAWGRRRGSAKCFVVRGGTVRWAAVAAVAAPVIPGLREVPGSVLLDCAWETAKGIKATLVAMVRCIAPKPGPQISRAQCYSHLFAASVPSANTHELHRIDFAFIARRGLLPGSDCLYLPARSPAPVELEALARTGAAWLPIASMSALFPLRNRLLLALEMFATGVACLRHGAAGGILFGTAPVGLPWLALAKAVRSKVFVLGLDNGVLEAPAVPWMVAAGIRTVLWHHALVGFGTNSVPNPSFRHRMLEQSVIASREVCVWTPADRELLNDRALLPVDRRPQVHVTGPLMSGDSRWLQRARSDAYQAASLRVSPGRTVIAVFDHPTFVQGFRRQYRVPVQRIPKSMHDAFFADIDDTLRRFPQVDIVFKPKRAANTLFYEGPSYCALVNPGGRWRKSGRLFILDPDIDPYLPIAVADLCIGMPFTSPVIVALNSAKPAFWYDPTSIVKEVFPRDIEKVVARGPEQLYARISALRSDEALTPPASLFSGGADPGLMFAAVLSNANLLTDT